MLAIQTRFIGPSNTRGARVKASVMECVSSFGRPRTATVGYHEGPGGVNEAHDRAARALMVQLGWAGRFVVGDTQAGRVYVRVTKDGDKLDVTEAECAAGNVTRPMRGKVQADAREYLDTECGAA